jgi:transposase InsO family protein
VPKAISVDNGKQFNCATFRAFCEQLGMKLCIALVYHPQSKGAVEQANGIILTGIKKNITEHSKGKWVDKLPTVIWSHNTTESRSTKFSPFKLLYGKEAMTPEEIKLGSWRTGNSTHEDMAATIDII